LGQPEKCRKMPKRFSCKINDLASQKIYFNDFNNLNISMHLPMNLPVFTRFDQLQGLYNKVRFISGPEIEVFADYDKILKQHKEEGIRTCVLIHCNDMVIVTHYFRNFYSRLKKDLIKNPNFEIILVTVFDYQSHCPMPLTLPNFTWIYYPEYNGIYWEIYCDTTPIDLNEDVEYYFLSMNKRACMFRQALAYKFYDKNWIETSIFTYLAENKRHTKLFDIETYKNIEKKVIENNLYTIPKKSIMITRDDSLLEDYKQKPLIQKTVTDKKIAIDPSWEINRNWYSKTYCNILIETDPDNSIVNLSEKTFRSIMMQHPLYLLAAPETYGYLESLNLKLLPENLLWNHGKVFSRFNTFLNYLDNLKPNSLLQAQELRKEKHQHTIHLRNCYYDLYKRMLIKQFKIEELILKKFKFLKKHY
jgi:hypothetical protein